ncbi:HbrB-like protein [Biscogniauxia mediterranea]|nr:HbrB-like protein [Biscogniauxia mediterranea]
MQQPRPQHKRAPGSFSPLPGSVNTSTTTTTTATSTSTSTGTSTSTSTSTPVLTLASMSMSMSMQAAPQSQPPQPQPQPPPAGAPSPTPTTTPAPAPAPSSSSSSSSHPQIRRIESSSSDDTISSISIPKTRSPQSPIRLTSPTFASFTSHPNSSSNNLHNFSRPSPSRSSNDLPAARNASPLTLPTNRSSHVRKHSQTQGLFEPTLPSTSLSNLSQVGMAQPASASALSASQIAAQAAMQHQQHSRHRSQTVPFPGSEGHDNAKRPGPKPLAGPRSPPMLSLTEASAPRDNGFGNQSYHNGLLGSHAAAATAAANVAFPRTSPQSSPGLSTPDPTAMPAPLNIPEKPSKMEKSKVKLFSRPKKIDTKGEVKDRPLPSPGKIGSALASLQRANFSTTSLAESQSFYNLGNASSATIRPTDTPAEREGKEKEKERKHHFLSRQKHKLSSKDDYHLPLSSAASNSRPVDPNAPSSLYNFNVPPSPGPSNNLGKSVSGLDLRHGGRALREKRKEDKLGDIMRHENDSTFALGSEWPGPGSLGSNTPTYLFDPVDPGKHGLNSMSLDDAWPYLKAKLLAIFEGEDLRLPVEDFNRIVSMHIQFCVQRRAPHMIVDDLRELLSTGFAALDHTLRKTPEDRLIPSLVELWIFTFTSILPYIQAVFLPLDLELSAASGSFSSSDLMRDHWGGTIVGSPTSTVYPSGVAASTESSSKVLDVRSLVLTAYRDAMILPRYEKLKTIFSRLSLEHLPSSLSSLALASPPPPPPPPLNDSATPLSTSPSDGYSANVPARPGTAMSLDPSVASYNSNSTTVFGNDSNPSRSRAISNVSYGSGVSDPAPGSLLRPFTPQQMREVAGGGGTGSGSGRELLGSVREQNVEDSKQVTEMVGRMLQCMSVLASVGTTPHTGGNNNNNYTINNPASSSSVSSTQSHSISGTGGDEASKMVSELGRLLKLNWLGRGRTGRNRRGMVGGRVKRQENNTTAAFIHSSSSPGANSNGSFSNPNVNMNMSMNNSGNGPSSLTSSSVPVHGSGDGGMLREREREGAISVAG